jgi:protein-S-isoprenylcysteine O-methyltransferase Ste14
VSTLDPAAVLVGDDAALLAAPAAAASAEPRRRPLAEALLDWFERLAVLALYAWLVSRLVADFRARGQVGNLVLMVSEGIVVLFLLLRRPSKMISRRPLDWLLAVGATCSPLLVRPAPNSGGLSPEVAVVILLVGLILQVMAKLALGRSFGLVAAHRGLKFGGPYQFVRHPMYLGYLICHVGFLGLNPSLWNLAFYALGDLLQVPRLLAEERLLAADADYREYQGSVRYRLIPGVF